MAILGMETQGWSKERAEEEVALAVRMALKKVLELAREQGITTEEAASRVAEKRLED